MSLIDKYFIKQPAVRRFITKLLYRGKEQFINIFNTRLFVSPVKENGYYRAFKLADKSSMLRDEISVLLTLSNLIDYNTTFVDVGANVGLFCSTMQRFQSLYPDLRIYAFEANPDTFQRLSQSVKGTGVKAFNFAISDSEHELEFVQGAVSHVFAERSHANGYHFKNQKLVKVPAKRLDQFDMVGDSIILKIDVEGHEYEVLEGARTLFNQGRIKAIYMDGYDNKKILPFLKEYGFQLYNGRSLERIQHDTFALLALSNNDYHSNLATDYSSMLQKA